MGFADRGVGSAVLSIAIDVEVDVSKTAPPGVAAMVVKGVPEVPSLWRGNRRKCFSKSAQGAVSLAPAPMAAYRRNGRLWRAGRCGRSWRPRSRRAKHLSRLLVGRFTHVYGRPQGELLHQRRRWRWRGERRHDWGGGCVRRVRLAAQPLRLQGQRSCSRGRHGTFRARRSLPCS